MRLTHFGPTVAGIKTVQILEELGDKRTQRKLVATFQDFCMGLKELKKIENRRVFESLWTHWKQEFCERVGTDLSIPEVLRLHFTNTMVGMARDTRRLYIIQNGWEGQRRKTKLEEELVRHRIEFEEALKETE